MSDRLNLEKVRKIHEIRAKLMGVVDRQTEISASLEVAMKHMKLCQTKLVDYFSKKSQTIRGRTDPALKAVIRQIRMLDLLGDDSFSTSLEEQNDSDEEFFYEDISLEALYKPDNYDLEQFKEDLELLKEDLKTDAVPYDDDPGDTVQHNVTI